MTARPALRMKQRMAETLVKDGMYREAMEGWAMIFREQQAVVDQLARSFRELEEKAAALDRHIQAQDAEMDVLRRRLQAAEGEQRQRRADDCGLAQCPFARPLQ